MKILMLTPYLPYPLLSGGQIRTYNLLKKLADKHEITLFALIKDEKEKQYIPEIEKYCTKVRVFKRSKKPFTFGNVLKTIFSSYPFLVIRNHAPKTIKAIQEELRLHKYDAIHAETFYMMPHLPLTSVPTILVEQTIEYLGYESYAKQTPFFLRPFLNIDVKKIKYWEEYYWQACDRLIVMSQNDKEFVSKTVRSNEKIEVVANGVDAEWFSQKKRNLPEDPTILFVGTFKWLPNVEAVKFLINDVWPKLKKAVPNVRLQIVGNAPTKHIFKYEQLDPQITVSGRVEDIRDAFNSAHVLIAPVFSGKGTRYKILEAMASGTPVVATEMAVEGLEVEDNIHVLTANTPTEMTQLIKKVLSNKDLRQKLSKNGKEFVNQHFDWKLISKKLDLIYQNLGKL